MEDAFIPYARQWVDEDDIAAVVEVLKSDYLTTGPRVAEFEARVAEYVGAKYAVAVHSGTAALHAAVFAAGIGPGDEVITTPLTFAATANSVLYQGAAPVFADIDPHTYNIDPKEIEKKITSRTKAIIAVHFAGQPCDMDAIHDIARRYNLAVIEDAAHALGAEYKGRKIGGISDMTTFSFHPVKIITTGEGGMVTTNREDLYQRLLLFRNHGITRDRSLMAGDEGPWYYEMQLLGFNYRMSDIHAALGISQLKKIDKFLALRRKYAAMYNKAFQDIPGLVVPYQSPDGRSSWHLYVLQLKEPWDRKTVFAQLRSRGIGVNVHYIPVYKHPYYQSLGCQATQCPRAERTYGRLLTLPLFPQMASDDLAKVIDTVKSIFNVLG